MSQVLGLLLAAGAGRRMGMPKAVVRDEAGVPFVVHAIDVLRNGGCADVTVVVGAAVGEVRALAEQRGVRIVHAEDWADGMGTSLRVGLLDALEGEAICALVSLVDLPDVGPAVVHRLLERLPRDSTALGRASYDGVPGHPVLLGRDHWADVVESARGDRGARDYLAAHPPALVECGDLATGRDVDSPQDLHG